MYNPFKNTEFSLANKKKTQHVHSWHVLLVFSAYWYAATSQRIRTFGSGYDACSQSNPYCESRRACAGVPGGPAKSAMPVLNYTLSPGRLQILRMLGQVCI